MAKEKASRKKKQLHYFLKKREDGEQIVYITAYDYPFALYAERAGVDMILVGDSLGMTTLGYKTTIPVTMDEMISHCQAVTRATETVFVVGDMPFMSYQSSIEDAVKNAGRFIKEAGCDAIKVEGGERIYDKVKAIVDAGIVVMGHLGLTPQNMAQLGGYKVQGKTKEQFESLVIDAVHLQKAGASFILLEAIPCEVAAKIREYITIPVYGIGAGNKLDGQLVIIHDILGMFEEFKPKFVKRYCEAGQLITGAIIDYCEEVREGSFPSEEHFYNIDEKDLKEILDGD